MSLVPDDQHATDPRGRIAARDRAARIVRRATVGVAVSLAALTAGLTGTIAAVTTHAVTTTDDSQSSTVGTQSQSSGDWGTSSVPGHASGGTSQTTTGGS